MKLYDFLQTESLNQEYKEFYFKCPIDKYFTKSQIYEFLFDDEINSLSNTSLQSYLLDNFQIYFENYLPKFIASIQNNLEINTSSSIFFGINDCGYITGFPYLEIDNFMKKIEKRVKKVLCKNLRIYRNSEFFELFDKWFEDNIQINFVKIDTSEYNFTGKYKNYLKKWVKAKKDFKQKVAELKKQHNDYVFEHNRYSRKLEYIIKDPIIIPKLINFIENHSSKNNPLIEKILQKYDFDIYCDDFDDKMNDQNHILYYLTRFKDIELAEIKKRKPVTTYVPNVVPINFVFQNIQSILEIWIKKGFNFGFIEIKYLNKDKRDILSLLYKMKWRYSLRIIKTLGDPGTHIMNFEMYEKTKDLINWRQNRTQEQLNLIVKKIINLECST